METPTPVFESLPSTTPDVVVTRDGLALVYAICGTPYDPAIQYLFDSVPSWLTRLGKAVKQPDLFLYLSLVSGRHCIGQWVLKPGTGNGTGLLTEVLSYDPEAGPGDVEALLQRLQPHHVQCRKIKQKLQEANYISKMLKEDSWAERQASAGYLKQRGMEDAAKKLARGATPFMGQKEAEYKGLAGFGLDEGKD